MDPELVNERLDDLEQTHRNLSDPDLQRYARLAGPRRVDFSARGEVDARVFAKNVLDRIIGLIEAKRLTREQIAPHRPLALARDLAIRTKHAPKYQPNITGHEPKLANLKRILVLRNNAAANFVVKTGEARGEGDSRVHVVGDVVDSDGSKLMSFDELVDGSLAALGSSFRRPEGPTACVHSLEVRFTWRHEQD